MTIGQALKQTRISLNLTQSEMSEGVMNRSFYSRVESGKNNINTKDLILLLHKHHVSIVTFLKPFNEDAVANQVIEDLIESAGDAGNVSQLEKIGSELTNLRLKVLIKYLIAEFSPTTNLENIDLQKLLIYPSENLWNDDDLWLFSLTFSLYDFVLLKRNIAVIFNNYQRIKITNVRTSEMLAKITVNYMENCLKEGEKKEFVKAKAFLGQLSNIPELSFWRTKAHFLEAKDNKLKNILNEIGYHF